MEEKNDLICKEKKILEQKFDIIQFKNEIKTTIQNIYCYYSKLYLFSYLISPLSQDKSANFIRQNFL